MLRNISVFWLKKPIESNWIAWRAPEVININYNQPKESKALLNSYSNAYIKAFYVESTFNNPTGTVLSSKARENILNYSKVHNIPIIEDDIYRDLWFEINQIYQSIEWIHVKSNFEVLTVKRFSRAFDESTVPVGLLNVDST